MPVRSPRGGLRLLVPAAVLPILLSAAPPGAAAARSPTPPSRGSASIAIRIDGLPKGVAPSATLKGRGRSLRIRKAATTVRRLPAGTYVLRLAGTTVVRGRRGLPKGSRAYPAAPNRIRVRVAKGAKATVRGAYGGVVAANVAPVPATVLDVEGNARNPTAIAVPKRRGAPPKVGGYLTTGPTKTLPAGLISRITGVQERRRSVELRLEPVPATTVVPEFSGALAVRPAQGPATSRVAPRRSGASYDLRYSTNPIAKAFSTAMEKIPCRVDSDVAGSYVRPTVTGPTFGPWSWSSLSGSVRTSMAFSLGIDYRLSTKTVLNCGGSGPSFTEVFAVPFGPIVLPMFIGASTPYGISVGAVQKTSSGHIGQDFTVDLDSARPDWLRAGATASPANAATDGGVAATLTASLGFSLQAGIGIPELANIRVEAGPTAEAKLSGADFSHVVCEVGAKFSASIVGQFLLNTVTKTAYTEPIAGPYQLPICTVTEPLIGTWQRSGSETLQKFKVEQTSPGQFRATSLTDTTFGDCKVGSAGDVSTISGQMGTYTWTSTLWDQDKCVPIDSDPASKLTIATTARDRLEVCRTYPSHPLDSGCRTYSRADD